MRSLFTCPLCAAPLARGERAYTCPNGHNYDIAREGYVHLLPANKMHSKAPGDDAHMARARGRFLSGEHYAQLKNTLADLAAQYAAADAAVLDSGCGEGYYTAALAHALPRARVAGVDLSKPSLKQAARRAARAEFAVASVYHLPVADGCADLLLNCFSPLALEEFRRVLKHGGTLLYVVPGPRHLWEMKEVLYDHPYENAEEIVAYEGFDYLEVRESAAAMDLNAQALMDLFGMTPYAWKTPKAGVERLSALETLRVTAQFKVHVFRRQ